MKKITIEIDSRYAEVLTLTVVGRTGTELDVATSSFDLRKTNKITISHDGTMVVDDA